MQIRGKIFTIAGIVLVFGYFIMESLNEPTAIDPDAVVMVGNDTLGRDWGAQANQREQAALQQQQQQNTIEATEATSNGTSQALIDEDNDPFLRDKFSTENYSTEQSPDGREIITGYNNPYQDAGEQGYNNDNYQTRHQQEFGEPEIKYRD